MTTVRVLVFDGGGAEPTAVLERLARDGFEPTVERVETVPALGAALVARAPDVVLAIGAAPSLEVLAVVRRVAPDVPVLVVAETFDAELARRLTRAGVDGYLGGDGQGALASALRHALGDADAALRRRRLNEHVLIAERQASLRALAASVTHEVNNPLAALIANLDCAVGEVERLLAARGGTSGASASGVAVGGEGALEPLRDAVRGAERIRTVVAEVELFAHLGAQAPPAVVDVRPAVEAALRVAFSALRRRARIVKELDDVPCVRAHAAGLAQLFLELVVNASQAIPPGQAARHVVRVRTGRDASGGARIEVSDTGEGIPPEHLAHVFEPFFTTRPAGGGAGLGLTYCRQLVTELGGELTLSSVVGEGTVVCVVLPAVTGRAEVSAPAPEVAPRQVVARPRRVLVIDDERLIGVAIGRMLGGTHEVVGVQSANVALERIRRGETFDVILCDLLMPEMNGSALYEALARLAPRLARRVVFMTGGAFTGEDRAFLARLPNGILEKPFTPEVLEAAIAAAVAAAA